MLLKFQNFVAAAKHKRVAVFLDYDGTMLHDMCIVGHTAHSDQTGTLAPIVNDPDRAFMSDEVGLLCCCLWCCQCGAIVSIRHHACQQMRATVRSVAQLFPTAIISGRGREKVEAFVKLKELYYAGSHGMDIVGPAVCGVG